MQDISHRQDEQEFDALEKDETGDGFYEGDHGNLPLEVRNLLIALLRGPYLLASESPKHWSVLLKNKEIVLQQLSNLYLTLTIDDIDGIAFIKQSDTGDLQTPTLLTRTEYKFLDSVLVVELRGRLMEAENAGQRAVISREEIYSHLGYFDIDSKTDHVGAKRRADAVIERFVKRHFLSVLPNRDNYEISPVLKVVFKASEIETLAKSYEELLKNNSPLGSEKEVNENE